MENLTDKQKECLIIINLFIKEKHYSPTIREIAKEMRLNSPTTVLTHLKELRRKGYITWEEGQSRTIRILKDK